jgi:hypothetical protein
MARTPLLVETSKGAYPIVAGWLTFTAGDASNGNSLPLLKRYVVYAKNTDGSNQTVLIRSSPDLHGRFDDNEITLLPGAIARFDGISSAGFKQTDGCLWIDVSSTAVELAVWELDR